MLPKLAVGAAVVGLAALALWHPARAPLAQLGAAPVTQTFTEGPAPGGELAARAHGRASRAQPAGNDLVVYVAGAVRRPGLYHLQPGDRGARAVELAGGMSPSAATGAVNLAQRASDGDEIYVPAAGEMSSHRASGERRARRHHAMPAAGTVDINRSTAEELASVPGIGRAIAERIVELREREGGFGSLDELLDVAGMTQSRLERARSYLRQP